MKNIYLLLFFISINIASNAQDLYWSQFKGPQLLKMEKGTTNVDTLIYEPTSNSFGFFIEYDTSSHFLIHASSTAISRTDTCMDQFVLIYETPSFVSISDMKLDAQNGWIYYVLKDNSGSNTVYKIFRCDVNGGGVTQIHQRPDDHEIRAFCLDVSGGHIYFNNIDNSDSEEPEPDKVKRISSSGSGITDYTCGGDILDMHFDEVNDDLYLNYGDFVTRVDDANNCSETTVLNFNGQSFGVSRFKVDAENDKLIWTEGNRIRSSKLDGSSITLLSESCTFRDIAPNSDLSMIYWINLNTEMGKVSCDGTFFEKKWKDAIISVENVKVDLKNSKIYAVSLFRLIKMNLDGSNVEILAQNISSGILDIDVRNQKLYFLRVASGQRHLSRINTDGTDDELFLNLGRSNSPTTLTVDSENCLLYWIDFFSKNVFRVSLDGCGMEAVVHTGGTSYDIDIHNGLEKIYWSFADSLCRADIDGSNRECLVKTFGSFTLTSDKVYWGDRIADALFCADLDGQNAQNILPLSDFDFVRSITCGDTMAMSSCPYIDTVFIGKISMDSTVTNALKIVADSCIDTGITVAFRPTQCVDLQAGFSIAQGGILEIDVGCP